MTDPAARNPKAPARGRTIQADRPSRHHPTIAAPRAARGARSGQPLSVPASRRLASVASRERDADAEATAAKVASTVLPAVNPIDAGCLPRGWPVDHLGHEDIWCPRCEGQGLAANQPGELFRVVCGSGFGFGTPWFVRPFLKHTRTAGKLGQRGRMEQCATCESVYLEESDGTARWWAERTGVARVNGVTGGRLALRIGSPR